MIVGSNGAGKSTILDALCFSLYGKAFRKINKAQMINTTNEKGAVVEIEFSINNVNWLPVLKKFFQRIFSKIITCVIRGNHNIIRGND